mmetsp:Transcript_46971/g.134338  ORF Transcript_46971/g.134338 Transcript_46971/m.134338 type:complete len:281 (+) Transcript_46971:795-1637(+)
MAATLATEDDAVRAAGGEAVAAEKSAAVGECAAKPPLDVGEGDASGSCNGEFSSAPAPTLGPKLWPTSTDSSESTVPPVEMLVPLLVTGDLGNASSCRPAPTVDESSDSAKGGTVLASVRLHLSQSSDRPLCCRADAFSLSSLSSCPARPIEVPSNAGIAPARGSEGQPSKLQPSASKFRLEGGAELSPREAGDEIRATACSSGEAVPTSELSASVDIAGTAEATPFPTWPATSLATATGGSCALGSTASSARGGSAAETAADGELSAALLETARSPAGA